MVRKTSSSSSSGKQILPEKYQAQFDLLSDAIVVVTYDGTIRYLNQRALDLFGYSSDALIHKSIDQLIPRRFHVKHETHISVYSYNPKTGPIAPTEVLYAQHKSGKEFAVEISLSPMKTEAGSFVVALVKLDLPDNHLNDDFNPLNLGAKQQLDEKRQELFDAYKKTISNLFQKLNQPIVKITDHTQYCTNLLENSKPNYQELAKAIEQISAETKSLDDIMQQFLTNSKLDP